LNTILPGDENETGKHSGYRVVWRLGTSLIGFSALFEYTALVIRPVGGCAHTNLAPPPYLAGKLEVKESWTRPQQKNEAVEITFDRFLPI